jgi:hypothetical protein
MSAISESIQLPPKYQDQDPKAYLDGLLAFIEEYRWMVEILAFDFITLDYWKRIDPEWRSALMDYMEAAGDDYAAAILDLTSEKCDYVSMPFLNSSILPIITRLLVHLARVIFSFFEPNKGFSAATK